MFDYQKKRSRLQRVIAELDEELRPKVEQAKLEYKHASPGNDLSFLVESDYKTRRHNYEMELEVLEAEHLLDQAGKWGVDGSARQETYDPHFTGVEPRIYFNPQNKALMRRMISDAKYEWWKRWVDLLSPVVATIISIIALIISIVAFNK
jgi:hypothetical protein